MDRGNVKCQQCNRHSSLFSAIQHCAAHPPPDQRRAEGGERAVARRAAGDEPGPQGDEGGPGA